MERLDIREHEYVEVKPAPEETGSDSVADAKILPVLELGDIDDSYGDPPPVWIKESHLEEAGFDPFQGGTGFLSGYEKGASQEVRVERSSILHYKEASLTDYNRCYLDQDTFAALQIRPGDHVEIFNEEDGSRMQLEGHTLEGSPSSAQLELHGLHRDLLDVKAADEQHGEDHLRVRRPPPSRGGDLRWTGIKLRRWFARKLIGYNLVHLRVRPGLDRDEERKVARIEKEVMDELAITPGDKIVVQWNKEEREVRCLPLNSVERPETGSSNSSYPSYEKSRELLTIHLPSTERDRLGVNLNDCVQVRRDTSYTFGKNLSVSLFGFLGAIIGVLQVAQILDPTPPLPWVGAALISMSALIVWFLLWPERQKCDDLGV